MALNPRVNQCFGVACFSEFFVFGRGEETPALFDLRSARVDPGDVKVESQEPVPPVPNGAMRIAMAMCQSEGD